MAFLTSPLALDLISSRRNLVLIGSGRGNSSSYARLVVGMSLLPRGPPQYDFEVVKERVLVRSLMNHYFEAQAILEDDLIIVGGLHPTPT